MGWIFSDSAVGLFDSQLNTSRHCSVNCYKTLDLATSTIQDLVACTHITVDMVRFPDMAAFREYGNAVVAPPILIGLV